MRADANGIAAPDGVASRRMPNLSTAARFLGAAVLVSLILAPEALATPRFAAPSGSTTGTCTPPDPPCTLQRAVEDPQTVDGDEVIVNPGDYLEGTNQLLIDNAIWLHGASGQPFPRIVTSASTAVSVQPAATTALVSRLTIEHTGSTNAFLLRTGTAEQIVARSTNSACELAATPVGTILRDSVCWVGNAPGNNAALFVSSSVDGVSYLRNVTAIATGSSSQGIFVSGDGNGATTTVDARNVIASGDAPMADVWADTVAGATATVTLDHSNYATQNETGPGTPSVTDPGTGTNQTSSPIFAAPAMGDFHQLAGSPTINAGDAAASLLGTLDFDGEPRTVGAAPDIGADEFLDSDGDGVPDASDACPSVAASTADGCPANPPPVDNTDTSPPDTEITKHPKDKTKKKTATFEFTSTEPGSTFECKLDDGQFQPCSSPDSFKVKKGKHSFEVRARDAAGNVDGSPATDDWKVKKKKRKR